MIRFKTPEEITTLAVGGKLLGQILEALAEAATVGTTGRTLDHQARQLISEAGATPSFLNYAPRGQKPFPAALCVSVNDGVVHGLPNDEPFKDGDIVKLDLGLVYQGLFVDSAHTVVIGTPTPQASQLIEVTKQALSLGIEAAKPGNTTGDIGHAIQAYIEANKLGVVQQLVGHGVGHAVHEDPQVPNFGKPRSGTKLMPGLVIAIEPMVTIGSPEVTTGSDGWTVVTSDGSLAAHEEHTIAITENGPVILTTPTA